MVKKTDLYISPLLTNISLGFRNDNYVAEKIFPRVQVKKDTGKIASYAMDNLRIPDTLRAQGSRTNEVEHTVSNAAHYDLEEHAIKELVTDEEMDNADNPFQPKIDAVQNLTDRLAVDKEYALASIIGATGTMSRNTTLTSTTQWDAYTSATSDPIGAISTGVASVKLYANKMANTLFLCWNTYNKLKDHPDILDRLKYSGKATEAAVKAAIGAIFGFENVIIGTAMRNSADEGQTGTLAEIWDSFAVVGYIEPNPTQKTQTLGRTYAKKSPLYVDSWRGSEGDDRRGDYVRVTDKYDQVLVDADCGYLIYAAIG